MPVLKRYNANTKQWEPINQAPAVGVYTDNAALTTAEDSVRSVEDVLVQNRQELDLLRKNVTWLALHGGGGGTGGGTGAGINNATIQIYDPADNTTNVSEFIWNKSYETSNLIYKISSNTSTSTYTVSIKVNGVEKRKDFNVKRNVNQTISMKTLGIGSKEDTISITAVDKDENEFTKNCKVIIASVILQEPAASTFTQSVLLNGSPQISLRYKVSVAGNYKLYYSDSKIFYDQTNGWSDASGALEDSNNSRSQYIDILNSGTSYNNININLTNIYNSTDPSEVKELISKNTSAGSYVRYFLLVKADNNSIYSSLATAQINVVLTNGMLVTPSVGIDSNDRYSVTADSILNLRFITWKGGNASGTYSYRIFVNDVELKDLAKSGQIFGSVVTVPINISTYPEIFSTTGNYDIKILANQTPYESTGICYVNIAEKSTDVVKAYLKNIKNYSIIDYTFWDATWNKNANVPSNRLQYENDTFDYRNNSIKDLHKTYMDFYNIGEDSGIKAGGGVFYKLTHTAGGQITCDKSIKTKIFPLDNNDTDALIPGNEYNFSLEIAYSIDIEPADDVVVFRMGNYDINTGLGQGIVITAHNYYVKIDNTYMTGALQDNAFTQFNLVCFRDALQMRWIYIYQNGVLLQAAEHVIPTTGYSLSNIDKLFVACNNINIPVDANGVANEANIIVDKPINTDLYAIKLYNTRLNDGEIVCSYINNYVNYKRTANGLDADLVNTMLQNNLINADKYVYDENDPQPISRLFNFRSELSEGGDYNWNLSVTNDKVNLGNLADLPDKSGIPVVVLSVKDWSWDQFIKTGADFVNIPKYGSFTYIYPGNSDGITSNNNVMVELQGTSTLGYAIKNLDITFTDEMFSPKDTWFPEKTFTLKADVVDSAHVNNAAIGTFVNDCINKDTNGVIINKGAFPAIALIDKYKNTEKTLPKNLTFKATIEGFPIVLVIDFENNGIHDPRVIGIYSFNLGRESYYNQGLEVLTKLRNVAGDVLDPGSASFPGMFGTPTLQDIDSTYDAYCFEGTKSTNATTNKGRNPALNDAVYDYAIVMNNGKEMWYPIVENIGGFVGYDGSHYILDSNNELIPWDTDHVRKVRADENGYFWSSDASFAKGLFECKYAKNETKAWDQFCNESGAFGADESYLYLTGCLSTWLPYRKGSVLRDIGAVIPKWKMTGGTGDIAETVMTSDTITLTRPQQVHGLPISIQNSAFYYVVCMLFGLIDNFGKNLQFKYWGDPDNKSNLARKWSPTFYDMDTALGISNTGSEDVPPTVFDESIINLPDNGNARFMYGQAPNGLTGFPKTGANPTFTVYSNKLWGCLEHRSIFGWYSLDYGSESDFRVYSSMWNSIRSIMVNSVDDLMDKYFTTNLSRCGEFLYNYDYYTKYLNTNEYNMLHGNRKSFIYNWLTERIAFLDSVFGYKNSTDEQYAGMDAGSFLSSQQLMPYNISWNNSINVVHNSGSITMPIKSNKSLIYCTQIGGGSGEAATKTYRYITKNQVDSVKIADSLGTQGIQTKISNSDCIIDFPDLQSIKLTGIVALQGSTVKDKNGRDVYDQNMFASIRNQQSSLSGLKRFDISGINTINGTINLFNLFKTWDTTGIGGTPQEFALQELNYSNTKTSTLTANLTGIASTDSNIPSIYKAPFVNLTSIDISNSLVSSVDIPRGITLQKLNIENSQIAQLQLTEQPLLTNINVNKCQQLGQVQLSGCNRLTSFILNASNVGITDVSISECALIKTITIDANGKWDNIPTITIQNCPMLEEVVIRGCTKDKYTPNINDTKSQIVITGTPNLKKIVVTNSLYTTILWDGAEYLTNLGYLDISNSTISRIDTVINRENFDRNFIDLRGFKSENFVDKETGVVEINAKKNKSITHVYVDNVRVESNGDDSYKLVIPDPFLFNKEECFAKCENLERVYGYFHVGGAMMFDGCTKFSILKWVGGESNKSVFKTSADADSFKITRTSPWYANGVNSKNSGVRYRHATDQVYTNDPEGVYNMLRTYEENGVTKNRYCWFINKPTINEDNEIVHDDRTSNMMLNGASVSGAFTKTNCNTMDVYYALFNCEYAENISGLFSECNVDFEWKGDPGEDETIENNAQDNSPNRLTFINCSDVTAANSVFSVSGLCKLKSPYQLTEDNKNSIGVVPGYSDNDWVPGIYTPLKKCQAIGRAIGGSVLMDKNILRVLDGSGDYFEATEIKDLKCKNFVNNINTLRHDDYTSESKSETRGTFITGDVTDLLKDCPNITNVKGLLNDVEYINYNTACGGGCIQLPRTVETINTSFRTEYAAGELKLEGLFRDGEDDMQLKNIYSSFRNTSNMLGALIFDFNNDTFNSFKLLENICIDPEESEGEDSFTGEGLSKTFANGFPYNMFEINTELVNVVALFQNADASSLILPDGLPGTLFNNCSKLQNVSRLFYNLKGGIGNIKLSSMSFANCPNIQNVSYAFACDSADRVNAFNKQFIPKNLFYHGSLPASKDIMGTNYETEITNVVYDASSKSYKIDNYAYSGNLEVVEEFVLNDTDKSYTIRINPTTTIKNNGKVEQLITGEEVEFNIGDNPNGNKVYRYTSNSYSVPLTNITNMEGCFQGGDWIEYVNEDYSIIPENDYDYSPFKYIKTSGVWVVNNNYSNTPYTYMWEYDGDWEKYNTEIPSSVRNNCTMLDDGYGCDITGSRSSRSSLETSDSTIYPVLEMNMGIANDLTYDKCKFCCAPDLLRYSASTANISKLFYNCGPSKHTYTKSDGRYTDMEVTSAIKHYGLKGRLVPYLLKPVQRNMNLSNMFTNCKFLGCYVKDNKAYPIPESFMSYLRSENTIDLTSTFSGWYFPADTNLDVFRRRGISMSIYTLNKTFQFPLFSNRKFGVSDISKNDKDSCKRWPATELSGLFVDEKANNIQNVFCVAVNEDDDNPGGYERNQSVKFTNMFKIYTNDFMCFAGYAQLADGEERFGSKTLSTVEEKKNYMVYTYEPFAG